MNPRTIGISLFIGAALAAPALPQSAFWEQQFPENLVDLFDVQMLSALDGWAAGADGHLRHTTNGGFSWSEVQLPAGDVRAVFFRGAATGWTAGQDIFRTTDGGLTWIRTPVGAPLHDIHFLTAQTGWVCGDGGAGWTLDGGVTWNSATVPGAPRLRAIHFADASTGWAVGLDGVILKSTDGGVSWQPQASGVSDHITAVEFADQSRGFAAAGTAVLTTTDGGATWQRRPLPAGVRIEGLDLLGSSFLWGAGTAGTIVRSSDGGLTWSVQLAAGGPALHDVSMGDLSNGFAVGNAGTIWRTTDGAQWTLIAGGDTSQTPSILDIDAVDANHAFACTTQGTIMYTSDGGLTWDSAPAGYGIVYEGIGFLNPLEGYACGNEQGAYFPTVASTSDGGQNWSVFTLTALFYLRDVAAVSPGTAVACGETWTLRTTNGGQSWSLFAPQPYGHFHGIDFPDQQNGWMVGTRIFKTSDAGATWAEQIDPPHTYYGVSFADAQTGWAVGENGAILKTTDGGVTWNAQSAGAGTPTLREVSAVDSQTAWIVGDRDFIARTLDGGATWQRSALPTIQTGYDFWGASFVGPDEGWISGGWGSGIWHRGGGAPPCQVSSYCDGKLNSSGLVAALDGIGSPSAGGSFSISVAGGVPGRPGLLFFGTSGPAELPFQGGTLCVRPPTARLPVRFLDASGATSYPIAITGAMVGQTRWHQFWYRDAQNPDGTGVALSDGLMVRFCP